MGGQNLIISHIYSGGQIAIPYVNTEIKRTTLSIIKGQVLWSLQDHGSTNFTS